MRRTLWILLAAGAFFIGALLPGLRGERHPAPPNVQRLRGGHDLDRPAPPFTGKPNPALGALVLEVLERPSPDRAVVRGRWARAEGARGCSLDLILPRGATLLEGQAHVDIADDAIAGEATWLLDFPTDRDLDLVARFCGTNDRGDEALEAVAQLVVAQR